MVAAVVCMLRQEWHLHQVRFGWQFTKPSIGSIRHWAARIWCRAMVAHVTEALKLATNAASNSGHNTTQSFSQQHERLCTSAFASAPASTATATGHLGVAPEAMH